ncbi:39S ribosomal protein L49, mitochondrial [Strigops habroptila]|uniref:Large ribosomal subunit protein mL49 n=1 Tax=Strigops habroptila TaxID=2489341 RepID=A0A672V9B0_STRHB|nr:39S ribosomal protein L49, mitochondrial [Strigops habroptila]XP_030331297.1 39S ribosomal protein L49, mitochondrial [Strigops habroptila]
MAAMAALGRRLLPALGRAGGGRRVQTPPGAPPPAPQPPPVEESTADFAFVERLLPPTRVPDPPPHPSYPTPSGWSPPAGPPPALPYFVRRSRHHNLPVYERLVSGNRRLTELRHVEGDLWALEREVRELLRALGAPQPEVRVNEVTGELRLKGHWGAELRRWLLQRGF